MAFPRKLLNEGEDVILDLRPHWWFMSGPTVALVASVILAIVVRVEWSNEPDWVLLATLALILGTFVWFLARYARWTTTNFVITTDRLIFRSGVLAKHGKEIPLDRLNDISFSQTFFERMIGAGSLMIESAGERGQETFEDIRRPSVVQNEIYRQIDGTKSRDATRVASSRPPTVPEQLEKLHELLGRGVITQAEFDSKKTKLLEQM